MRAIYCQYLYRAVDGRTLPILSDNIPDFGANASPTFSCQRLALNHLSAHADEPINTAFLRSLGSNAVRKWSEQHQGDNRDNREGNPLPDKIDSQCFNQSRNSSAERERQQEE